MLIEAAIVEMHSIEAGLLARINGARYVFIYSMVYAQSGGLPLSVSLPLSEPVVSSEALMPYFDGLVAEGWLKEIQSRFQKVDESDRFQLLINNGLNLAGAVTIRPLPPERLAEVSTHGLL